MLFTGGEHIVGVLHLFLQTTPNTTTNTGELDLAKTLLQAVLVIIPLLAAAIQHITSEKNSSEIAPMAVFILVAVYFFSVAAVFLILEYIIDEVAPGVVLSGALLFFYLIVIGVGAIVGGTLYRASTIHRAKWLVRMAVVAWSSFLLLMSVWQLFYRSVDPLVWAAVAVVVSIGVVLADTRFSDTLLGYLFSD